MPKSTLRVRYSPEKHLFPMADKDEFFKNHDLALNDSVISGGYS